MVLNQLQGYSRARAIQKSYSKLHSRFISSCHSIWCCQWVSFLWLFSSLKGHMLFAGFILWCSLFGSVWTRWQIKSVRTDWSFCISTVFSAMKWLDLHMALWNIVGLEILISMLPSDLKSSLMSQQCSLDLWICHRICEYTVNWLVAQGCRGAPMLFGSY